MSNNNVVFLQVNAFYVKCLYCADVNAWTVSRFWCVQRSQNSVILSWVSWSSTAQLMWSVVAIAERWSYWWESHVAVGLFLWTG